jgi:hypothetical protein
MRYGATMFKLAALLNPQGRKLASLFAALMLSACASPNHADSLYINTMISGELMPGVYGQVNIGSVPDYVTIYDEPMIIAPQPVYAVPLQPIYLYVPPYHAYHWRDHCGYYNACARPVYFVCARDYRPHYFESRYYNTRFYDPPRVYRHHRHDHNRHYESMPHRNVNNQPRYYRHNDDRHNDGHRGDDRGRYYRQDNTRTDYRGNDNRGGNHRQNDGNRNNGQRNDSRPDGNRYYNNRQENRGNGDRNQQRQQFINNTPRTDVNRQQITRPQYNNAQPQRNDMIRVNSRGNDVRRDVRPAEYRPSSGNQIQTRERAQMPVQQSRQPSYRPQAQEQRGSGGRHYGGGNDDRRREERRDR